MADVRKQHSRDAYNVLKLLAAFFALSGKIFHINSGFGKYINTKIIRAKFVRALFFIEKEKPEDAHHHHHHLGGDYQTVLEKIDNIKFTWRDKFFLLYNLLT